MSKKIKFNIIPNTIDMNEYKNCSFILPLEGFSVGFEKYFTLGEINKLAESYEVSVIINKFLHKNDLDMIKELLPLLKNIKYFFIEDFGLINLIDKSKIVLYPNHIISNYKSINYLKTMGIDNVVVSNELSVGELKEIKENTNSNLYYFYIGKNNIMYSNRELVSNYYENYDIKDNPNMINIKEVVSAHDLTLLEESRSTVMFDDKIFCASKYLGELSEFNLIVNFSHIEESDKKIILDNLNNLDLYKLINSDYKFLEEKIFYKVGDLK